MARRALVAAATVVVVSLSGFRTAAPLARANVAPLDEFVHTVNWVAETYGTGPIPISVGPLPQPTAFAMTMGQQVVLNSVYGADPQRLAAEVRYNIDLGWFPSGCSPMATVALHEAAHVIDNVRGRIGTKRVAATYQDPDDLRGAVSLYSFGEDGIFDPAEAVASAFQAVLCNGGTEVEQEMYWMLVQP